MIEITETAKTKIIDLLIDEHNPLLMLRTFVQGGGCSGFSYGFTFDETQNEDDFEIMLNDKYKLLIDAMSMNYMNGAVIDFNDDIMGSNFNIKNPNAQTTCGCGSSFSV
jgi:iron-sulfur cluster insertion protein